MVLVVGGRRGSGTWKMISVCKQMGSGYGDYYLRDLCNYYDVPVRKATEFTLRGLGQLVQNYDEATVTQVQWPPRGTRSVCSGTGLGGVTEGEFSFWWEGDMLLAKNAAVGGSYKVCRSETIPDGLSTIRYAYTREANYHPDGGQIIYPNEKVPFYLLLAPEGDDVTPKSFKAFYFDGTCGFQIAPGVWHQPAIPVRDTTFRNKQGSIHACVAYDSKDEHNMLLRVNIRTYSADDFDDNGRLI